MITSQNIADFLLENYYQNIYPNELGTNRIKVPIKYKGFEHCKTYRSLAKAIVGDIPQDEMLEKLHKEAFLKHSPKKEIEEDIHFPICNGLVLSAYALRHFGDTHALDKSTNLRQKLDQFLAQTYGSKDLTNLGIIKNEIASTVWSYNVTQNVGYVGLSLIDAHEIPLQDIDTVWVFENDNTAQRIFAEGLSFPFIIASGRPTKAFHQLLQRLIDKDTKIYYHGDMDLAGINMFDTLKSTYPNIEAPFMTTTEFEHSTTAPSPKEQNYKLEDTHLPNLVNVIKRTKQVVYEEQLDLKKCLSI